MSSAAPVDHLVVPDSRSKATETRERPFGRKNKRRRISTFAGARHLIVAVLLAGSSGCVYAPRSQSEIKFMETRELDLAYEQAYGAAVNALFTLGLQIQHSDKASGVISGQSGDYVQRASAGALWRGFYPVKKVSLLITPAGSGRSLVRMKVLVNEQPQLDRTLMTRLWQLIEREAMLDADPVPLSKTSPEVR